MPNGTCKKGTRKAATLVELLTVVAIISMMLAILLPALGNARAKAKVTICQANLYTIRLAFRMYLDQNRETMPYVDTSKPSISLFIWPHLSSLKPFQCPADENGKCFFKYGSSYFYYNMELGGRRFGELMKTRGPQQPMLRDYKSFHGPRTRPNSINCLYLDGSIGPRP
jgi:competence protein ComGC